MDVERARAFLLAIPYVAETMQWGDNLVFWVGDKTIGGKMFALINLDAGGRAVMSFAATKERQAELCEREGLIPAPYLARGGWVAAERWDALPWREWQEHLNAAYEVVRGKLPRRTLALLETPANERATALNAATRGTGKRPGAARPTPPKAKATSSVLRHKTA